jgi:selenocysteine-specific elongation factor
VHVIATAGHVDHGKSTLVTALTGTDPDRLVEEKTRGLTIDLGFAFATSVSGRRVAFVDVPGHVRFVKNMLAGVGMVDACLFVVAATEGWKPQSEEHLRILELLGIRHGVLALTKSALVTAEGLTEVRREIAAHVEGTFLADAEVVAVDAPSGVGLDDLRSALDALLITTPEAADRSRPRLWIDRSFTVRGAGRVVTGTLTGGSLRVGEQLEVRPGPHGRPEPVRIRALQTHNEAVEVVAPGNRVALNLASGAPEGIARGDALVRPDQFVATDVVDATLHVLDALGHEVSRKGAYLAYFGSGEHPVRLRLLGATTLSPGETGLVRIYLPVRLPLVRGDRYVLRESGRAETVGGGETLDVAPVRPASRARPDGSVTRLVAERGFVGSDLLEMMTGEEVVANVGRFVADPGALAAARARLLDAVSVAGEIGLDTAVLGEQDRAVLETLAEEVVVEAGRVRPLSARPPRAVLAEHPFVEALTAQLFSPPPPAEFGLSRVELAAMVRANLIVKRGDLYFAQEAVEAAAVVVAGLLDAHPEGVSTSVIREALGTTRKFALPLLEHLDASGITRRRGDVRLGGPRLARVASAKRPRS